MEKNKIKKTISTLLSLLFCAITFAQSVPQGINYQAVARDANGDVLMNQALTIQFSVISDITTSAADISANYTDGTYSDWFLPSKDELNEMFVNLHQQGLGNFADGFYWSSTQSNDWYAWLQDFGYSTTNQTSMYKNYATNVRAVRAF